MIFQNGAVENAKGAVELNFFFKNDGKYLAKNEKNQIAFNPLLVTKALF